MFALNAFFTLGQTKQAHTVFAVIYNSINIMSRGSRLSAEEQAQIRALHQTGKSIRQIAAYLRRSKCAVINYLKGPANYGTRASPGRPTVLSSQDVRHIQRLLSNSTTSISQVKADLSLNVSRMTIWRAATGSGSIVRESMKRAPRLTDRHRAERLQFARKHMTTDWNRVHYLFHLKIFSGQKHFLLSGDLLRREEVQFRRSRRISLLLARFEEGPDDLQQTQLRRWLSNGLGSIL